MEKLICFYWKAEEIKWKFQRTFLTKNKSRKDLKNLLVFMEKLLRSRKVSQVFTKLFPSLNSKESSKKNQWKINQLQEKKKWKVKNSEIHFL